MSLINATNCGQQLVCYLMAVEQVLPDKYVWSGGAPGVVDPAMTSSFQRYVNATHA